MEDYALDIVIGKGAAAKSIRLDLPHFTLIGATTRIGMLTSPLRDRFGVLCDMVYYTEEQLKEIIVRSAFVLGCNITEEGAYEIARRSRGTPRIANRLLKRVRDYAEVYSDSLISFKEAKAALELLEVDAQGFDRVDNKILEAIIDNFNGGPVGIETLSYFIGEELGTIEDVYEPYLLQKGFIVRTARGRTATDKAYSHLGRDKGQKSYKKDKLVFLKVRRYIMKTSDFDFYLPEELIAQHPLERRDYSRLMVLDKETGEIEHKHFYDVIDYLNPGDTLVLNNTRVMPARLIGEKAESGGKIEFLLLKRIEGDKWECLAKPGKRAKIGTEFTFGEGKLKCKVVDIVEEGNRIIEFSYDGIFEQVLDELGEMPLPPYITERLDDKERYQTVYSKEARISSSTNSRITLYKRTFRRSKGKRYKYSICNITCRTWYI